MPHSSHPRHTRSVLARLRALIPARALTFDEALRLAELQATHLLLLQQVAEAPIPEEIITELPRLRIASVDAPVSGACYWDGAEWVIELNRHQSWRRQRFVLAHEYKHILDHGYTQYLYPPGRCTHGLDHAEYAADYFAGCLLVPRTQLKRAFAHGIQRPQELAALFDVTESAIETRLRQTGVVDPPLRCIARHHQRDEDRQPATSPEGAPA